MRVASTAVVAAIASCLAGCVPFPAVSIGTGTAPVALRLIDRFSGEEVPEALLIEVWVSNWGTGFGESGVGVSSYELRRPVLLRSGDRYFPQSPESAFGLAMWPYGFSGFSQALSSAIVVAPGYSPLPASSIDLDWDAPGFHGQSKQAELELVWADDPADVLEHFAAALERPVWKPGDTDVPLALTEYPLSLQPGEQIAIRLEPGERELIRTCLTRWRDAPAIQCR